MFYNSVYSRLGIIILKVLLKFADVILSSAFLALYGLTKECLVGGHEVYYVC